MGEGRLRWFGHVRRRSYSAPVRRVEALVVDSLRRKGRPKLRWEDRVKHDMKELLLSGRPILFIVFGGFGLGDVVGRLEDLDEDRVERLDSLDFAFFRKGVEQLLFEVKFEVIVFGGFGLGDVVGRLEDLDEDRVERLDSLDFAFFRFGLFCFFCVPFVSCAFFSTVCFALGAVSFRSFFFCCTVYSCILRFPSLRYWLWIGILD
nr:ABC transporter C family member 2 [Tanacetum cinerariifolium]